MADALTQRLAELDGTESALVLSSGSAATACTILALLRPGDHMLASNRVRSSTRVFLEQELPAMGAAVTFIDPDDSRGWRRSLRNPTRAMLLEAPSLEDAWLGDWQPQRTLARELGLALVVDSTAASPILLRPAQYGADVVLHDAAFLLDGAGGNPVGVVCGSEGLIEEVRAKMELWGALPHPHALRDLERGLDTLEVRVLRQSATTHALGIWAQQHPAIMRVTYSIPLDPPAFQASGKAAATVPIRQSAGSIPATDPICTAEDHRMPLTGGVTCLLTLDSRERLALCLGRMRERLDCAGSPVPGTHVTRAEASLTGTPGPPVLRLHVGLEAPALLIDILLEALAE